MEIFLGGCSYIFIAISIGYLFRCGQLFADWMFTK